MFRIFIFAQICVLLMADISGSEAKKTICLNMIVKDESYVIERCLESVKNFIDYWVIVDTGSRDNTKQLIKNCLKDIPGELYDSQWENFEVNRNEALELAKNKGDYLLLIDADEHWVCDEFFTFPNLNKDYYLVALKNGPIENKRISLINNDLDWYWKGVIHEDLLCDNVKTWDLITHVVNITNGQGNRSQDPFKLYKDIAILEKALEDEPCNSRYIFYLGEIYFQIKNYLKALEFFERRVNMNGWQEEVFWSLYRIGIIKEALLHPQEEVINAYCLAYLFYNQRAEPLYKLACYYKKIKNPVLGYFVLKSACDIPFPKDGMFIEHSIYDIDILLELSNCAYAIGKVEEAMGVCEKILCEKNISPELQQLLENNIRSVQEHLQRK